MKFQFLTGSGNKGILDPINTKIDNLPFKKKVILLSSIGGFLTITVYILLLSLFGLYLNSDDYQASNLVKTELFNIMPEKFNKYDYHQIVFSSKKSKIKNPNDTEKYEHGVFNYNTYDSSYQIFWTRNAENDVIIKTVNEISGDNTNTIYNLGE